MCEPVDGWTFRSKSHMQSHALESEVPDSPELLDDS